MFDLTSHIARHPIADEAYLRHLRTADVFNEVQVANIEAVTAFGALMASEARYEAACKRQQAAKAKAKLIQSMEDL